MKMGFRSFGLSAALLLTPFSTLVHSFPTAENFGKIFQNSDVTVEQLSETLDSLKNKRLLFDPLTTPISVTGANAFQPPNFANGDQRGPCPGLNALANHGYLSRDGIVNPLDVIINVNKVLGMGIDLTTALSFLSTIQVGNPISLNPSFSIGGPSAKVTNVLLGSLLPIPQGIDATHNVIEADGSSTRDDILVTGDSWTMNMTKFLEVYNSIPVNGAMTMDDIAARAAKRLDESIATNPYFYYGPYSGVFARNGGYLFAGRLLSNHSVDFPRGGNLTRDVLASFWGVYKDSTGALVYKKGWEQIPANWYRSAVDYSIADIAVDLTAWATKYPRLISVGGNMGTVNSFAGIDFSNVTGGLLNAGNLLQGNNLVCFAFQVLQTGVPSQLATVYSTLTSLLGTDPIGAPIANLSCPIFTQMQLGGTSLLTGLMNTYPGASKSGVAL